MKIKISNTSLEIVKGDITTLNNIQAIVNAANSELQLGLGVAGAIRKRGGNSIQNDCDKIISKQGSINVGQAVITQGGNLYSEFVIHAVGPYGNDPNRKQLLKNAINNSLTIAIDNKLESIAFPAISTGIFGYPLDEASEVIIQTCIDRMKENLKIKRIIICLYDEQSCKTFENRLQTLREL